LTASYLFSTYNLLPAGVREVHSLSQVQVPALPYQKKLLLLPADPFNSLGEVADKDNIRVDITQYWMAADLLSRVKCIVEQWSTILISVHFRDMSGAEFSRHLGNAMLVAKKDNFAGRSQLQPALYGIALDDLDMAREWLWDREDSYHSGCDHPIARHANGLQPSLHRSSMNNFVSFNEYLVSAQAVPVASPRLF